MDLSTYCNTMENQLAGWKAKIYDVIRVVERLDAHQKEAAYPSLRGLQRMAVEIDDQLEQLKAACPAEWSASRRTLEAKMGELERILKTLSDRIQGSLIPDSLSWVSP